jgi:hypothetical protein
MARAILTATALVPNGSVVDPTGTANVVANGQVIPASALSAGPIGGNAMFFIRCSNATGATTTVTIAAGSQPSAISSGQGALVSNVAATTGVTWIGPLDSSRFQQPDGSIFIDSAAVVTTTVFTIDGRRV